MELDLQQALEASRLIWPKLLSKDDCILLADQFSEENYSQWRSKLPDNPTAIENVINHVHLWDVFPGESSESELLEFAGVLISSWRAAARSQFPERDFEVLLSNHESDYGPTVYMTTIRRT